MDKWDPYIDELNTRLAHVLRLKAEDLGEARTISELDYTLPRHREAREFRRTLTAETDRTCALYAAQYIDNELLSSLRKRLVEDDKISKSFFEDRGACSTFSSRIDLARLVGLVSKETALELHRIRKIRNAFAHHAGPIHFSTEPIASHCRTLTFRFGPRTSPRGYFCASVMGLLGLVHNASAKRLRAPAELDFGLLAKNGAETFDRITRKVREEETAAPRTVDSHTKASKENPSP